MLRRLLPDNAVSFEKRHIKLVRDVSPEMIPSKPDRREGLRNGDAPDVLSMRLENVENRSFSPFQFRDDIGAVRTRNFMPLRRYVHLHPDAAVIPHAEVREGWFR